MIGRVRQLVRAGLDRWALVQAGRRLQLANYWRARDDLDEAVRHGRRALQLVRAPAAAPAVLAVDVTLAMYELERERAGYAAAWDHLMAAQQLVDRLPAGPGRDRMSVRVLMAVGDRHRRAGRHREAEEVLDQARRLAEACPAEPTLLAGVLTLLGITAKEQGAFLAAAHHYDRVERLHRDAGASACDAAALRHNLAGLAHARQRYVEAEEHARAAVALRRGAAGATPVDVAEDVAVLAAAVAGQGRYDEARALLGEALATCRSARPPREYEIAVQVHNLASIEQDCGHPTEAEDLYRQAMSLKERLLGRDHPEVGLVANNLATLLCQQGRDAEAAALYERALAIAQASLSPEHPTTIAIRRNLARAPAPTEPRDDHPA